MRYAPIVKVRKQELDRLENDMAKMNFNINSVREQIEDIKNTINNSKKPTAGVIANMVIFHSEMNTNRQTLAQKNDLLAQLEIQRQTLIQRIKLANVELEKMKYLEEQEILKHKIKLQKQEAANLDEIGLILFNNRQDT